MLYENHNHEKLQYTDQTAQKIANYFDSVNKIYKFKENRE